MRYFLRIQHRNLTVNKTPKNHTLIESYLPIKTVFQTSNQIFLQTYRYDTNDKSIIQSHWEQPFYEDDKGFLFIGGYVLNRLKYSNANGIMAPTPKEIYDIVKVNADNLYDFFKGSYYLILFNKENEKLTIYSSPMNVFPAFYSFESDIFIFTNILEFILQEKNTIEIDSTGLIEFSLFDHTIGNKTIYKDIFSPLGGTKIELQHGKCSESLVYDVSRWINKKPKTRKSSINEINKVLDQTIQNYIAPIDNFNISLTGGFDGRLNFSFLKPYQYKKAQAFSYGKKESLQISIPQMISKKLGFKYKSVLLETDFVERYADLGMAAILLTSGITPYRRANYLYGYNVIKDFSRNCIIGQCDLIRPLYTNPAGAIFNQFSKTIFFSKDFNKFEDQFKRIANIGYVNEELFSPEVALTIYNDISARYLTPYSNFSEKERYFIFLYSESMIKFWQTECHLVDFFVDDFISFSDLDYIEILSTTKYFGLYKGIFATNQYKRRKAHDLYIDLMKINNNRLNHIVTDRMFKPIWLNYGLLGYIIAYLGKEKSKRRRSKFGNDTFGELEWSSKFYEKYKGEIYQNNTLFKNLSLTNNPYESDNTYRFDRHISLKLWLQHAGINL